MEKKATRRIIGILVVVALVIILLPLFNVNDSQNTLQTAEVKAPPFPDPQNDGNVSPTDTTAVAENNNSGVRAWFHKVMSSHTEQAPTQAAAPDKTVVLAQSTIQPTISDDTQSNMEANQGTITPPKQQDTLIANSAMDSEEEVEQGTIDNNVTVSNSDTTPPAGNPQTIANTGATTNTTPTTPTTTPVPSATNANPTPTAPISTAPGQLPSSQPGTATPPSYNQSTIKPITPAPTTQPQTSTTSKSNVTTQPATTTVSKAAPEELIKTADEMKKLAQNIDNAAEAAKPAATNTKDVAPVKKPIQNTPTVAQVKKPAQNPEAAIQAQIDQLKKTAWVVQLGSFKSKINAVRLTNALRAKGYKAFTYETKSNGQTRVYIGPEFKQSAAITTASRIQADMKMRGIVLSYKPLEL